MTTEPPRGGPADDDRAARAALARLAEPGDAWLGRAVAGIGAPAVLARVLRPRDGEPERLAQYRVRIPSLGADAELTERADARVVVPGDGEWQVALDDLGDRAPLCLWVAGPALLSEVAGRAVAVVGARASSDYGDNVAAELASGVADRGWTVVSGGAFGIDAAAHRGALAVEASTVAVLACGVDVAYPRAHEGLFRAVRSVGAVVSELPPGSHPTRVRFLDRNRVIAALAQGTVVVEATTRSGALNTAGHAGQLNRVVMAVPGPVTSSSSAGCHKLLRTLGASLVTSAADVVDLLAPVGEHPSEPERGATRPYDGLDPVTLRVLEALPLRRRAGPDSVGQVAGLDPPTVLRALGLLGALGLAESHQGRWRRRTAGGGALVR